MFGGGGGGAAADVVEDFVSLDLDEDESCELFLLSCARKGKGKIQDIGGEDELTNDFLSPFIIIN